MVDLLVVLTIAVLCVVGAELTRRSCRRQLMAPVVVRPVRAAQPTPDRTD